MFILVLPVLDSVGAFLTEEPGHINQFQFVAVRASRKCGSHFMSFFLGDT
jgi:hypothetical protein